MSPDAPCVTRTANVAAGWGADVGDTDIEPRLPVLRALLGVVVPFSRERKLVVDSEIVQLWVLPNSRDVEDGIIVEERRGIPPKRVLAVTPWGWSLQQEFHV